MNLLIAIPALDQMQTGFVRCLIELVQKLQSDKVRFTVDICSGTLVHAARDKLACKAINEGFTHVLWLDSDMVFSPELLEDLQFSGKKFVSGIAHSRRPPYVGCLFKDLEINRLNRFETYPQDTFRVAGCGFACVLIDVEILRAVMIHYKTCFCPLPMYGEDLAFCKRATELGFEIWAEPGVRLGHIGLKTVYPEDHEKYMREIKGGADYDGH